MVRHLVEHGLDVSAADIAPACLAHVAHRFPSVTTIQLNGRDLANIEDSRFDLCTAYSVLHHIPDYIASLRELGRVLKPGGVLFIDHENNEEFWRPAPDYRQFRRQALRFDWRKYLRPENYYHALRRLFDPRHVNEGDIHVWPDDHIDWAAIRAALGAMTFEIVEEQDYLGYRSLYRREVYDRFEDRCTDTKLLIARKPA